MASTLTGRSTSRIRLADIGYVAQAGRVEHVGAGLLVGLQPGDRVRQVRPSVQVVLGAGGEHEGTRPAWAACAAAATRSAANRRS